MTAANPSAPVVDMLVNALQDLRAVTSTLALIAQGIMDSDTNYALRVVCSFAEAAADRGEDRLAEIYVRGDGPTLSVVK